MQRTGLHLPKVDWKARGRGGGWSRSMSLVWLLFLQWGRWGSKQILTFSRRDWKVYSPHSEALQLGLSIAGSGPNFGPWTWYSESVWPNSHVRPMWVIATCPFSLCSLPCDFPRWVSLHSCYHKPSDQRSALLAAACSTGPGSVVMAMAFHQDCPSQPPAR